MGTRKETRVRREEKPEGNQEFVRRERCRKANQDTSHGASADSGSSDDSGASISRHLPANADGYDSTDNNDFGDSVVIMGPDGTMGGSAGGMQIQVRDVTENDGKTGSIEAYTETAAEKVKCKRREYRSPGIQRTVTQKKRITSGLR